MEEIQGSSRAPTTGDDQVATSSCLRSRQRLWQKHQWSLQKQSQRRCCSARQLKRWKLRRKENHLWRKKPTHTNVISAMSASRNPVIWWDTCGPTRVKNLTGVRNVTRGLRWSQPCEPTWRFTRVERAWSATSANHFLPLEPAWRCTCVSTRAPCHISVPTVTRGSEPLRTEKPMSAISAAPEKRLRQRRIRKERTWFLSPSLLRASQLL